MDPAADGFFRLGQSWALGGDEGDDVGLPTALGPPSD
jgi:hypothetical protein